MPNTASKPRLHWPGKAGRKAGLFATRQFQKSYRLFIAKHEGKGKVPAYRLAQAAEYGAKTLFRLIAPGDRAKNRVLSEIYRERFRLQFLRRIVAAVPDQPEAERDG